MVVRDADDGVEVFLLRRHTGAAFAAGMYVFPGGRVDEVDGAEGLGECCDGPDDAAASELLGVERGGLAFLVAAIRECFEESGLLLAHRRDGAPLPVPAAADRVAVHDGALSMLALCRRDGLVLDTAALRYVAHWVTPEEERTRRFDTRFFLAPAPPDDHEGVHDDVETIDSVWTTPAEAMRRGLAGEIMVMPPTMAGLELLEGCATVADVLLKADGLGRPARIEPHLVFDDDGRVLGAAVGDRIMPIVVGPRRDP